MTIVISRCVKIITLSIDNRLLSFSRDAIEKIKSIAKLFIYLLDWFYIYQNLPKYLYVYML